MGDLSILVAGHGLEDRHELRLREQARPALLRELGHEVVPVHVDDHGLGGRERLHGREEREVVERKPVHLR